MFLEQGQMLLLTLLYTRVQVTHISDPIFLPLLTHVLGQVVTFVMAKKYFCRLYKNRIGAA